MTTTVPPATSSLDALPAASVRTRPWFSRIRPGRRLRLRARITLAFGLGALLLSALLSFVTWGLTRENLLNQRDQAATERVLSNAITVKNGLGPEADLTALISSLPTPEGANPLLEIDGEWTALNDVEFGPDAIPASLIETVESGEAAKLRYHLNGKPVLTVGVPIPASNAAYFEGVSLVDIEDTLEGLGISLLGAAAVTTLAGASLGFYASRRALLPLTEVGRAAEAIAGGRLDTRLEATSDPDLTVLTTSFNDMAQALQDRVERDARFASEVSHELRSPLMTLAASIEVMEKRRDELPERVQTALDLLRADVDRFQQLVEDLLEISRFDAGAVHLTLEDLVAREMVVQAVETMVGTRVPVQFDPDARDLVIRVDKRRMGQVIANLLDNAAKYADGASLVSLRAVPSALQIVVEDSGPGVADEEKEIIFDRFSRGSAGGSRGADTGTGLGLALIDEHVRLHGGRVWVEDREDGAAGARFVIELPVVDPVVDPVVEPT